MKELMTGTRGVCISVSSHPCALSNNMLATYRRDKILELLQADGSAKVLDLARLFKVTEVTIRQDLEKLERDGLINREHGGAYIRKLRDLGASFSIAHREN